ncbi:hypothetical protein DFS33DRAFT_1320472 [Desarmillaria ectypa]|nr:hypothetical protein DFS33DRAFT_1320472 [Desarmillaria ectypa]
MSGFAALMALSATQTRESQKSVETALAERQRRERERRQKQDEADRKQRELEAKLRLKHFEDEKREKERQRLKEEKAKALEAARLRREEEERDHLRYGAKKPGKSDMKWPSSSSQTQTQESVRKRRLPVDDDEASGATVLTREEKRQRKEQAQYRNEFRSPRRTPAKGYSKAGRQLPGGAIDVMTTTPGLPPLSSSAGMTTKERLTAVPMHLIKLNTNKRDTRTIDEIVKDMQQEKKRKTLSGEDAKAFSDWFSDKKKTTTVPETPKTAASASSSQSASQRNTPISSIPSGTKKATSVPPPRAPSSSSKPVTKTITSLSSKRSGSTDAPRSASSKPAAKPTVQTRPVVKKRPRSPSSSVSPPPPKRRPDGLDDDMRSQIWAALGKNRSAYVGHDDFSDDEDMEADASVLEREELYRFVTFQPPWFTAADTLLAPRLRDVRKRRPWLLSVGMKKRKERSGWRGRGVVIRCVALAGSRGPFLFSLLVGWKIFMTCISALLDH